MQFYGFVQDQPFLRVFLTVTGNDEANGLDKIYVIAGVTAVPEPATVLPMALGLSVLAAVRRRPKSAGHQSGVGRTIKVHRARIKSKSLVHPNPEISMRRVRFLVCSRRHVRTVTLALSATCTAVMLAACAGGAGSAMPTSGPMNFFVTSVGSGKGADLGGLAGADAHCQKLASAAGNTANNWRAYLSVPGKFPASATATAPAVLGEPSVNARDRIGKGPWFNAKAALIARDLEQLHNGNNLSKDTALDERGTAVKGRGDTPNEHDILTGSRADGTAFAPQTDTTCKAWTSSTDGSAIVGHHDLSGPLPENWAKSWNFSHQSAGCSQEALVRTGGSGRLYCFAAN